MLGSMVVMDMLVVAIVARFKEDITSFYSRAQSRDQECDQ